MYAESCINLFHSESASDVVIWLILWSQPSSHATLLGKISTIFMMFFLAIVASTDVTHCSLYIIGHCNRSLRVSQNRPRVSLGTAMSPVSKSTHTRSLILLSKMLSWLFWELCKASLHWSQRSQEIFQSFWSIWLFIVCWISSLPLVPICLLLSMPFQAKPAF